MTNTKRYRDATRDLSTLGYEYDHTNSKGAEFWVHPDTGAQVRLSSSLDEQCVRRTLDIARHAIGVPTKTNKRNPQQIRERNAAEHDKALRELEAIQMERWTGDEQQIRAVEDAYLAAERKWKYWDRLMRSAA